MCTRWYEHAKNNEYISLLLAALSESWIRVHPNVIPALVVKHYVSFTYAVLKLHRVARRLNIALGALLEPSWGPDGALLEFCWNPLGPSWGPLGALFGPLGAFLAFETSQDGAKTTRRQPKTRQEGSRTAQDEAGGGLKIIELTYGFH